MSDISSKISSIISEKLGIEEKDVIPSASFANDLGADSLDIVELIMEFEKEFNISISDQKAEKITTVKEAIESIKELIKDKQDKKI
ncbi:acyl carrier protein [Blattabacterium cuenoti]|uniref:acyl carrier protein n=1 Tax=Blattabacterium cuenoti TaxID=1653831 RepID=UPI00163CD7A4|nr:acyl carrier protein [Blattabacterium cuenoti]